MKRIPVMIVDDEKLAQEDLLALVDWNVLGFEVVATAFNGRQALSKYKQFSPKIIFTDMRMPFMDGVELIENLRGIDKQAEIIVLSAYEDFAYAKTAIRFGISDYVIKSEINRVTLTELLIKLRGKIYQNTKYSMISNNQILSDYFIGKRGSYDLKPENLLEKEYHFLIVEQDIPINISGDIAPNNIRCPKASVDAIVAYGEYENSEFVALGALPQGQTLIVLNIKESSEKLSSGISRNQARRIKELLEKTLNQRFTVFYTLRCMYIEKLKKMLADNPGIFLNKYYYRNSGVVELYYNLNSESLSEVQLDKKQLESIKNSLDADLFDKYVSTIFVEALKSASYKSLCELSGELFDFLRQQTSKNISLRTKIDLSFDSNWQRWLDFYEIESWFKESFCKIAKYKDEAHNTGVSRLIEESIKYIHNNYSNPNLSLSDIAENVHLSVGYLCVLFKSETNTTIKNYIVDVRIDEARKLLAEGYDKIYYVANSVGYVSSQYFSQVFFKKVGMYPNEYRKGFKGTE